MGARAISWRALKPPGKADEALSEGCFQPCRGFVHIARYFSGGLAMYTLSR
jgi:hypothetical protein